VEIVVRCFGIGAVAGLRSMTAPAATLLAAEHPWRFAACAAAAGELVVDKLPIAPSRLQPSALAVRMLSGALCGRALARRFDGPLALGTCAGVAGLLAGAFGGYYARRSVTREGRVPDVLAALVEDALAVGLAVTLTAS
jgi:uncharacterized membrane protein